MTPSQRRSYSGIYQGLNYTVRASFNNQLEFHSRHIAVPAFPTAQDFSHPCCLCVQSLTFVIKSAFVSSTLGIEKREAYRPEAWGLGLFLLELVRFNGREQKDKDQLK